MTDTDVGMTIPLAAGRELRRARDSVGWTRAELAARLPDEVHPQTLAAYERGVRQCTLGRFVDICRTLGVSASDVLSWALQRAEVDLEATGFQVDLDAVIRDKRPELLPLRRWARARLADEPDTTIVRLEYAVVREIAALFSVPRATLVSHLISFTPSPNPRLRRRV